MIYIDFETRSKADITKEGAWRYAEDPSTEPLCLAFAVMGAPVDLWVPGEVFPRDLAYYIDQGQLVEAHNAFFERAIWRNIMVPQYGWPDIPDAQWACSASRVAAHAIPRALDKAGAALGLAIQKDQEGKRIMMKLTRPRKPTKNNSNVWHEDHADYRKLYNYCVDDIKAERALSNRIRPLSDFERQVWLLDQKINERGVRVDLEAVEAAMVIADQYKGKLNRELERLTRGEVVSASQNIRLLDWLEGQGLDMDDLTKASVIEALENVTKTMDDIQALQNKIKIVRVLEIRQQYAKTSTAKYAKIRKMVCKDGTLKDLYLYHGAGTGRWTGKGVQPQNLPRNKFKGDLETAYEILKQRDPEAFEMGYPDVLDTLSSLIRGCFIPSEGKTFYGGDYAAIETRVLFWLAGEEKGLKLFHKGKDLYVDMAKTIYEKEGISKDERTLGKQAMLGAGYQMGHKKFRETCAFHGIVISEDLAQKAIQTYRNKYDIVVRFWNDQEWAAKEAVVTGWPVRSGKVLWKKNKGFLYCRLPSGRCLAYYDPRVELVDTPRGQQKEGVTYMHVNSMTKQWERTKTYGGKLVENITQAVARDLMVYAMLNLDKAGYEVVMHTHDEIITEIDERGSVRRFGNLMAQLPNWGAGIPMNVDGWKGKRYLK